MSTLDIVHGKSQELLEANLAPDDEPRVVIQGSGGNSALIGTDRRVFIFKPGPGGGSTGSRLGSWDYRNIAGVQLRKGALLGEVTLDVPGAAPANSRKAIQEAQNTFQLNRRQYAAAEQMIIKLRELIADWHTTETAEAAAGDSIERALIQIGELGKLRDQGLVTPEEFKAKKLEVLKRL